MTDTLNTHVANNHTLDSGSFARRLLSWFEQHGRKDLPWQQNISPYTVWLSEVMLQQTQVSTVIPYFHRFIERFPSVELLANAAEDEVLHLWSGLGYYSRARNLHKAAQMVASEYGGTFPGDRQTLESLPGVGRSTAAAICATAFEQAEAILDGNVKRVLARHDAIEGWPGKSSVSGALWSVAEQYMSQQQPREYTQAIMDLGALVCTRSRPNCAACPVNDSCVALRENCIAAYPGKKPKKTLPVKQTEMLILQRDKEHVLLEKRPPSGIWGGLWSFPESRDILNYVTSSNDGQWPVLRHTFSHYHLDITPVIFRDAQFNGIMEKDGLLWYNIHQPPAIGLAAPVSKLLKQLSRQLTTS